MTISASAYAIREVRAQTSGQFPLTLSDLRSFLERCEAIGIPADSQFRALVVVQDQESRVTQLAASLYETLNSPSPGQVAAFVEATGQDGGEPS